MAAFGRNPWPRRFGGGKRAHQAEHEAALEALLPGYDVGEDTAVYAESYAHALGVAFVWAAYGRAQSALLPTRMLETLPDWEQACGTRPSLRDDVITRRAAVAGKMRGLTGNRVADLTDACRRLLGDRFDSIATVAEADEVAYWPGINPGPPGFEWSSNRLHIALVINKTGLSEQEYIDLRARAFSLLDSMLPAWMSFSILASAASTGSAFIVNQGIVGSTIL